MENTIDQAKRKLEHYCAYQERCHSEVQTKLFLLQIPALLHDEIIVHLIQENYLNEERFARAFARGKHLFKHWGKIRIKNELKQRQISEYLIQKAFLELPDELYFETFDTISQKKWDSTQAPSIQQKKKKVADYLFRRGFESEYIYDKIRALEREV